MNLEIAEVKEKETKEVICYTCGYCGKIYQNKINADCCHRDRVCSECGIVIGKKDYYMNCSGCRSKKAQLKLQELINKAKKISYDDYIKEYPNYPVVYNDEFFFDDYDYLLDKINDNKDDNPIIWGTKQIAVKLDSQSVIERFEEETELEEYKMDKKAREEIEIFCNEWDKKYGKEVYFENTNIIIRIENTL